MKLTSLKKTKTVCIHIDEAPSQVQRGSGMVAVLGWGGETGVNRHRASVLQDEEFWKLATQQRECA